jgi:hypothetical protein
MRKTNGKKIYGRKMGEHLECLPFFAVNFFAILIDGMWLRLRRAGFCCGSFLLGIRVARFCMQ